MTSLGIHLIIDAWDCPPELLNDLDAVRQALVEAVEAGGVEQLIEQLVEGVSRRARQIPRRDPDFRLRLILAAAHRHAGILHDAKRLTGDTLAHLAPVSRRLLRRTVMKWLETCAMCWIGS